MSSSKIALRTPICQSKGDYIAGEDAVSFIVQQTECSVIFVNTLKWSNLKLLLETGLKSVKTVVYWGPDGIITKVSPRVSCSFQNSEYIHSFDSAIACSAPLYIIQSNITGAQIIHIAGMHDRSLLSQEGSITGVKIYSFKEFLDLGGQASCLAASVKTEDTCTIMYTSGTTGNPKVSLLHMRVAL